MMPLRKEPYAFPDLPRNEYAGLPPAFADSLPDAFGRGLIDRWLEERGCVRFEITALDRLAYVGRRSTGALTYEPDHGPGGRPAAFEMRKLVDAARMAANGELADLDGTEALRAIIRIGSSIGECDDHTKNFSFMLKEGGEWQLAPAYDLTGSRFPSDDPWSAHGGRHQLSVNGKQSKITDDDLLTVADRFAIGTAPRVLREVKSALA